MKTIRKFAVGTGKVCLALLAGVLFPILIWVALGVAVNQRIKEKKRIEEEKLRRTAVPTMGEILGAGGLKTSGGSSH